MPPFEKWKASSKKLYTALRDARIAQTEEEIPIFADTEAERREQYLAYMQRYEQNLAELRKTGYLDEDRSPTAGSCPYMRLGDEM